MKEIYSERVRSLRDGIKFLFVMGCLCGILGSAGCKRETVVGFLLRDVKTPKGGDKLDENTPYLVETYWVCKKGIDENSDPNSVGIGCTNYGLYSDKTSKMEPLKKDQLSYSITLHNLNNETVATATDSSEVNGQYQMILQVPKNDFVSGATIQFLIKDLSKNNHFTQFTDIISDDLTIINETDYFKGATLNCKRDTTLQGSPGKSRIGCNLMKENSNGQETLVPLNRKIYIGQLTLTNISKNISVRSDIAPASDAQFNWYLDVPNTEITSGANLPIQFTGMDPYIEISNYSYSVDSNKTTPLPVP